MFTMKNIILAFFTLTFCCQLFGGESQDPWMLVASHLDGDDLVSLLCVDSASHTRGLTIAAERNDEQLFRKLLKGQAEEQKRKTAEFVCKMCNKEQTKELFIQHLMNRSISDENIAEYMHFYRGEIVDKDTANFIRKALKKYNGKVVEKNEHYKTIKDFAHVKRVNISYEQDKPKWRSLLFFAITYGNQDSVNLLMELTQGKVEKCLQEEEICEIQRLLFETQFGLVYFFGKFLYSVFCSQPSTDNSPEKEEERAVKKDPIKDINKIFETVAANRKQPVTVAKEVAQQVFDMHEAETEEEIGKKIFSDQNKAAQIQQKLENITYSADQLQRECDKIAAEQKEIEAENEKMQHESPPKIQSSGSFPHKTIFAALLGVGLFAFIYWHSFYQSHVAVV